MCAAEGLEAAAAAGEEASRQTAGETPGDTDQQQDQDRYAHTPETPRLCDVTVMSHL